MCCPACLGAAIVYLAGATSAGGVAALALQPVRKVRQARSRERAGTGATAVAGATRQPHDAARQRS